MTLVGKYVKERTTWFARKLTRACRDRDYLESLVAEVQEGIQGLRVSAEEDSDSELTTKETIQKAINGAGKNEAERLQVF